MDLFSFLAYTSLAIGILLHLLNTRNLAKRIGELERDYLNLNAWSQRASTDIVKLAELVRQSRAPF